LLADKQEELQAMERDMDLILESYAALAPEAQDTLSRGTPQGIRYT
jgi:hypothetical protein